MSQSFLLCCVTLIWCASRIVSNPTTAKYTYNSSDLSYLSNGIQFPVDLEMQALVQQTDYEEVSQNQWFSRLYDHYGWWRNLRKIEDSPCKEDMAIYLAKLDNGTSWALKMFDASGRYSGQFFFGNDYWLGSKTLCEELANVETNSEVPPFDVQFYVAKIRINLNKIDTPVTRQLNLGECLPKSCGVGGTRTLLAQENNQAASLNIVGVRKVPGDYSLLSDLKVHLVGGYGLVVLFLIIAASFVEFFNARRSKTEEIYSTAESNNNSKYSSTKDSLNGSSEISLGCEKSEKKKKKKKNGIPLRLLLSFSAISNGKKIISVEKPSLESIHCIHGLRFFSISWIILVHSFLEVFAVSDNKNYRILTERSFTYQTISNATFSVDTFFFISGLLVTLTYFRTEYPKHQAANSDLQASCTCFRTSLAKFLWMIVYRFFRLTPPYLFVLGVNEIVMRYLHSNSVFSPAIIDHVSCDSYWWRNVLYINNFFPQHEFCMLWSWYIANDTQFYVIASFLLVIAVRGPKHLKFASILLAILLATSWIVTFLIALEWQYTARVEEPFALFDQLYDKPWLRIGPYLVGMMAGYGLFRMKSRLGMPRHLVALGWCLAVVCLGCLVYGLGRKGLVVPASAFYAALGHSAWGLALAWITVACCTGNGGPINGLLSFKLFLPLSRLTYCAYLIHPVLMCFTSFYMDGPMHLHRIMAIVVFCGNLVLSFLSAFIISLAFEAPVVNLLKIVFS
ncbi:unnamed protein product [Phaedon cochleariae]|uniref:Nose resistant-to-fluoxetine protein N-terminal domain-containing protein n=1 Tax=Phaedon cochleariae TaxID=80249 RepID=A0A9P0GM04_PHACE|nr:unnamed protein product [Phaedon cochleariae]